MRRHLGFQPPVHHRPVWTHAIEGRTPSAELKTWGLVRVRVSDFEGLPFELGMLSSRDCLDGEVLWTAPLVGSQVACAGTSSSDRVGLTFPWAAVAPGVLVVRDVMCIATNALLLDEAGGLAEHQDAAYLTSVVYRMDWQAEVLRRLQR